MEKQKNILLSGNFYRELAILSLFYFLAAFAPFVGVIAFIFLPLPIFYYYSKNGRKTGLALLGLSLALFTSILIIIDLLEILSLFAILITSGLVMAEAFKRGFSLEKTVLFSVGGGFMLATSFILYQSFLLSETPWHLVSSYIENKISLTIKFYEYMKMAPEQVKMIKENAAGVVSSITMVFPAVILVILMFVCWLNLLAGRVVFQKYGLSYPDFGAFSLWKAPEKMVWFLIVSGAILLLPDKTAGILGWNMLIVALFVYLLAGTAIVSYFLNKVGIFKGIRYLVYFLIFAQQIFTLLVVAAGVIDLWADFRKLNKPSEDAVA